MHACGGAARHFESGQARHADVQEQDVGVVLVDQAQRLGPIARNADDVELRPDSGEPLAQVSGEVRLIVCDQRPRRARGCLAHGVEPIGSASVTRVPGCVSSIVNRARAP
jgi:hypothetical protein